MTAAVLQMIQQLDPHEDSCLSMDVYSIRVVPCWVRLPFLFYRAPSEQIHYTTEKAEVNMNTTTEKTRRDVTTQYGVCGVEGIDTSIAFVVLLIISFPYFCKRLRHDLDR